MTSSFANATGERKRPIGSSGLSVPGADGKADVRLTYGEKISIVQFIIFPFLHWPCEGIMRKK